jgi:hypothetical protein
MLAASLAVARELGARAEIADSLFWLGENFRRKGDINQCEPLTFGPSAGIDRSDRTDTV